MAEGVGIEFNIEVWSEKLAKLTAATGQTMREALYEEWPLLIRKIMDFTPPFRAGGSSSDLSVGRAAVNRDIRKTMRPFEPAARNKSLAKVIATRNVAAFNVIASRVKNGPMAGARAVAFSPTVHTSQRNSRGRVNGGTGNVVLGSDSALLRKYITEVQSRVGYAKSGWLKALLLTGGDAPSYVARHGTGGGEVIDNHADEENPNVIAINRTPWAVRKDEGQRIIRDAYASRANALTSKIRTKIRLAAQEKAGFDMAS